MVERVEHLGAELHVGPADEADLLDRAEVEPHLTRTRHDELSDAFLNYILEKETQDRFLTLTMSVVSRKDVTVPPHWIDYPATNDDLKKRVALISMEGWERLLPHFDALDARFKEAVLKTSGG